MDDQTISELLKQAADEMAVDNPGHVQQIRHTIRATGGVPGCRQHRKQTMHRFPLLRATGGVLMILLLLLLPWASPEPLFPPEPVAPLPPQNVRYVPVPIVMSPYPDPLASVVIWPIAYE